MLNSSHHAASSHFLMVRLQEKRNWVILQYYTDFKQGFGCTNTWVIGLFDVGNNYDYCANQRHIYTRSVVANQAHTELVIHEKIHMGTCEKAVGCLRQFGVACSMYEGSQGQTSKTSGLDFRADLLPLLRLNSRSYRCSDHSLHSGVHNSNRCRSSRDIRQRLCDLHHSIGRNW